MATKRPHYEGEETVQTTLRLPKALNDRLVAEAKRRVLGKSRLVELILVPWLEGHEGKDDTP